MSLSELKSRRISDLRGSWTRAATVPGTTKAQYTYRTNRASEARNMRFEMGRAVGREGYPSGESANGKVTALAQWLGEGNVNRIVSYENGRVYVRNPATPGGTIVVTVSAYSAAFAFAANRAYAAFFDTACQGAAQVQIFYPLTLGASLDKAFMGPMSDTPTASEPISGFCTAGVHKFGYIVTSRSGFQGKPSPYTGASFLPISFTVSADKTVRLSISAAWPIDGAFVSAVMTTTENLDKYFLVPGTEAAVPAGVLTTITLDISISDEDLEADATVLTDHLSYLTQMGGVGPITPLNVLMLGRRAAYFTGSLVYVSDQDDYEVITADQHIIQLPGGRAMVTGFQLRGVNYLLGPSWTYAVVDNEDVPVTWATPYAVSQSLGTSAVRGICVSTAGDYVWVANEQGLWGFDGAYPDVPVSYMNEPEWKRINWSAANAALQIVDDTTTQRVHVLAPLDGASDLTHVLTWSYARGNGPMDVDFSLDDLATGNFSSGVLARGWGSQRSRLILGPNAAAPFLFADPAATYDGTNSAITSIWESGSVFSRRGEDAAVDHQIQTIEATVKGMGQLLARVYNKGRGEFEDLDVVELAELPDDHYQQGCFVVSPDCTVRFMSSAAAAKFDLADFSVYYNPWLTGR